jgi:EAL and modified HD-GYP domain-containing signal transduction protein
MLDVMLGTTLEEALGPLALPETVSLALQQEAGPLGPYLHLARACETDLDSGLEETAALLGLTEHQVAMAHLEALAWAENLGI